MYSQDKKDTTKQKPYLKIWGSVETDAIYNIDKIDPEWTSFFRPSKIPVRAGEPGWHETPGNLYFSVKPSSFRFEGVMPVKHKYNELKIRFEFDLIGMGPYKNETGLRFRLAYADWANFRIGKDWSTFIDLPNMPNIYEWWGPSGMALLPTVTFRYTADLSDNNKFEAALEIPGAGIDIGDIRNQDPIIDSVLKSYDVKTKEQIPDFVTRFTHKAGFGYFKIMTLLRDLEYEKPGKNGYEKNSLFGWAINSSLNVKFLKGHIKLQGVFGNGYAGYNNDGGVEIAPVLDDNPSTPITEYKAYVPFQYGFTAFYDYKLSEKIQGSFGYSETTYDNTESQSDNAFHRSQYAVFQVIYTLAPNIYAGLNYQFGKKFEKDGTNGYNQRLLFSLAYTFKTDTK